MTEKRRGLHFANHLGDEGQVCIYGEIRQYEVLFDINGGKSHPVLYFKRFKSRTLIPEVDYTLLNLKCYAVCLACDIHVVHETGDSSMLPDRST